MALKKNHISPIFKKLKINLDTINPNPSLENLDFLPKESLSADKSLFLNSKSASFEDPTLESVVKVVKTETKSFQETEIHKNLDQSSLPVSKFNQQEQQEKGQKGQGLGGNLTGYSRVQELKLVKIGIASSEQMMSWAEKLLPNGKIFGEVLNPNTLHYKTFKPQKGGLFCQRIFGPMKDFECACGIIRKPSSEEGLVQSLVQDRKPKRTYCSVCDVEYTWSVIRRYQLGYIRLASPVTHLWYLKANPSYLSMLLDLRKKDLEDIIYCTQTLTLEDYWRPLRGAPMSLNPNLFFESYKKYLTASNYNLGSQESWDVFTKKQQKEKQKRKNVKPRRRTISYLNSKGQSWNEKADEPLLPSLALRSKKDQIESLETAYRLSSDDYETRKFARLTHVASILMDKKISRTKKDVFLKARDSNLQEFYKRSFTRFAKKSFLAAHELDQKNHNENEKQQNFLNKFTNQSLKEVLRSHLKGRDNGKVRDQNSNTNGLHGVVDVRWGAGTYYRYGNANKRGSVFNVNSPDSLNSETEFNRNLNDSTDTNMNRDQTTELKNRFLTVFLNFIRKAKVEEFWESIYKYPFEATLSFSSLRKNSNSKNFAFLSPESLGLKFMEEIFSNSVVLYLLFVLQNSKSDVFISKFLILQKQYLVQLVFTDSTYSFVAEKNLASLKDILNKDLVSEDKTMQTFMEMETVLQNSNLNKFTFQNLQLLLKIHLIQQVVQKRSFYTKKTFKIFLVQKTNHEQLSQIQSKFALHFKNVTHSGSGIQRARVGGSTQKFETNLKKAIEKKKIVSFMSQSANSPHEAMCYLKHLLQLQSKLRERKYQKLSAAFQLFNNIYTTSYVEAWQTEKDWKYFLYYNKALVDDSDQLIPAYRARFPTSAEESKRTQKSVNFEQGNGKNFSILGANILQKLLFQYEGPELKKMAKQHQNVIPKFNRYIRSRKQSAVKKSDYVEVQRLLQTRDDLIRRLKLLRKLFKKNTKTSSMILNTIPVLPPDLRPILKMQNQIAASDLNRFYQRILYRNDRLRKFIRSNAAMMNSEPAFEVKYAQRLLQEAVDNLIQNGKGQVKPETNSRGQPLKSLSEILKGKQGRFRQYLLGKRVDYSGRSVIVVGPALKIYECGLPFEMAMELFLPFLIKRLFQYDLARTVMGAKTILKNDYKTTWHLLEEIMQHHPILLNRAPTLHRLGIQAFRPKLIAGRAILLHPLVCPAFNADFDGDQMAVHVPITVEARTEAWKLMFSRNHLISPATGEPVLLPTQDMVLGCYYLTTTAPQDQKDNANYPFASVTHFYFSNMKEILHAYLQEKVHLQTPVWMRWNGILQSDSNGSGPYEIRVLPDGSWLEIQPESHRRWSPNGEWNQLFVKTTPGRILFNLLVQNCIENKI